MTPFLDEHRIDSEESIAALDSRGALRSLATAGAQVREALTLSQDAGIERVDGGERPRSVLVASLVTEPATARSAFERLGGNT